MGFLLRNHYISADPVPAFSEDSFFGSVEAVKKWRDIEEVMLIKQGDRAAGASITEIAQEGQPDDTLTYDARFGMSIKVSPLLPQIVLKGRSLMNDRMQLERFHATADIGPAKLSATGKVVNNILYLRTANNNKINFERIQLEGPVSLAEAVRPALGSQVEIAPGKTFSMPVMDPLTGANRGNLTISIKEKETITVEGENVKAFRVVSSIQDIETIMWIDAYGQTLKRNLVGNFTMERTSATRALDIAPALAEPADIPDLEISEFKDVPLQQTTGSNATAENSTLSTIRRLIP